jgi:RNA polymerase sigma-70 factor (ECF subfamily)
MRFRKNAHKQISLDDWVDKRTGLSIELGGPDLQLNGVLHRMDLQAALDQLPEGYRTAFVLYDIQGFDHKEIAQMFGHSVGSSKSQLHKARRRLRELLSGHFSEPARQNPTTKVFKRSMSNVRNIGEQNSAI